MNAQASPPMPRPLRARKGRALKGLFEVPGDKSISQRALILGALAAGETQISGLLESEDVLSTAGALKALGAAMVRAGAGAWRVTGGRWHSPAAPLDFGNSGTGSRLVMGAVAGLPITATFTGDASLRSRPMARVLEPLTLCGARFEGQGPKALMPVTVHGARAARAIDIQVNVASAQVKSALLLAALHGDGVSQIAQEHHTRDHTEKMLKAFGANISVKPFKVIGGEDYGDVITLEGPAQLKACLVEVPRDPSSAAFAIVAALIVPGSMIELPGIMLNERRIGLLRTLEEMGADVLVQNARNSGGERIGDLVVRHSRLKGVVVPRGRAASMIDEYPILAIAAAFAEGDTVMRGLEELRVKESDRLAAIMAGLAANGVEASEYNNDLTVRGGGAVPGGGTVSTHMDHRIAMSFLTMGLASEKPVTVDDVAMIATSFPDYEAKMRALGADLEAA